MLITSEKYLSSHTRQALAFRRATLKGWEYALNNPEEISQHIYDKYSKSKTKEMLLHEAK